MKRFRQHNFTLVEMLVVVAIIAILIGITIGGYKITRKKIDESRTKAALGKMKLAIESFKNKYGYYPQGNTYQVTITNVPQVDGGTEDFEAFIIPYFVDSGKIKTKNDDKLAKILNLIEIKENHGDIYTKSGTDYLLFVDSYPCKVGGKTMKGRPIYYVTPGDKNTTSYDLFSAGPDGDPGSYKSTASTAEKKATEDNIWAE